MRDPVTREEWQEAVDAAHFLLCLESARQYGLVEGGPEVDIERCVEIIDKGKAQGYEPKKLKA